MGFEEDAGGGVDAGRGDILWTQIASQAGFDRHTLVHVNLTLGIGTCIVQHIVCGWSHRPLQTSRKRQVVRALDPAQGHISTKYKVAFFLEYSIKSLLHVVECPMSTIICL